MILDDLITYREIEDSERVAYLSRKKWDSFTPTEKKEWLLGSARKTIQWLEGTDITCLDGVLLLYVEGGTNLGSYNHTDLNRVGEAVLYVWNLWQSIGNKAKEVDVKTDYAFDSLITQEQMDTYLENVRTVKGMIPVFPETPQVPEDMENLTTQEANDIEQILIDVGTLVQNVIKNHIYYTDDLYCGEV